MSQIRAVLGGVSAVWAIVFLLAAPVATGAQAARTLQDGVFTDAQANRGQALYTQRCAGCHAADLTGGAQAPPLDGPVFRFKWRQEPLSALFIKIRYTMPPNAPDTAPLTPEQGADLVAHILKTNRFPSGKADFAAADAATSTIGWPSAPATGEQPPNVAARYPPTGTVNQLMRSIFFHNANLLFSVQEVDPKDLPGEPCVGQAWGAHDLRSGSQDVHRMAGGRKRRHRARRRVDAVAAAWASVPERSTGSGCRAGLDPVHGSDGRRRQADVSARADAGQGGDVGVLA